MRIALVTILALLCLAAAPARAAEPYPGTVWTEEYFPSGDGTLLHADILRPAHLPKDARTPVILTVSPYTVHTDAGRATASTTSSRSRRRSSAATRT